MQLNSKSALELKAGDIILLNTESYGPGNREYYARQLGITNFDIIKDIVLKAECVVRKVEQKPHETFIYVVLKGSKNKEGFPIPCSYFTYQEA